LTLSDDPGFHEWQRERFSIFTTEQGTVISRFLRFMTEHRESRPEHAHPDAPRIPADPEGYWPT